MNNEVPMTKNTNWWNAANKDSVYLRWTLLVILNAAFPFFLAMKITQTPSQILGILFAILSFIVIYAEAEHYLLKREFKSLAKQLRLSGAIKIATVLLPFIDMLIGAIALEISRELTGISLQNRSRLARSVESNQTLSSTFNLGDFGASYLTTMIDGVLLSVIVAMILGLIRFFIWCRKKCKEKQLSMKT